MDGVCLTVDAIVTGGFEADCSQETLARTTLGTVAIGDGREPRARRRRWGSGWGGTS